MFRMNALSVCLLALTLAAPLALAQDEPAEPADPPTEAPKIDPLTGQPVQTEEVPAPEVPAGPDLSAVNELVGEGEYADAEALLVTLLEEWPESADVMLMYGEVLVAQRKLEPAVAALEKCAATAPELPRVHFQLGSALAQLGQNERALEMFGKELELNEDKQVLLYSRLNRTAIYGQMKDWASAAGELEAVIVLDPAQTQAYGDLVSFYLQAGQLDEAGDALARGEAVGFTSADHYYSLGARLYRADRLEDCIAAFNKTIELNPEFARAERSLGNVYGKLEQNEEAVQHFKRYLELAPDAPDAERITELIEKTQTG